MKKKVCKALLKWPTVKAVCGAMTLAMVLLPGVPLAVERTGEILRELLQAVEKDFESLDRATRGFAKRGEALTKELEEKSKLGDQTEDPVRKKALTAEILNLGAQLNELDRKEVEAALGTINQVRGKLHRIRDVLQRGGGILPAREELPRMRQKMGKFLSTAAEFLDKWEKSSPGKKGEIAALKATLVGVLHTWESPATNIGSSQEELARTIKALDTTYTHLVTLAKGLEQEKQYLLIRTNAATAELVLLRLNGGKVNVGSVLDSVEGKRKALNRRREILAGADGGTPLSGERDATLGSEEEAVFNRMKRGDFEWSRGGGQ